MRQRLLRLVILDNLIKPQEKYDGQKVHSNFSICYFWPTQCFINKYKFCYDQFILLSIILPWLPVLPLSLNEFRHVWFNYINHILMTTQEEGLSSTEYCSMIYLLQVRTRKLNCFGCDKYTKETYKRSKKIFLL